MQVVGGMNQKEREECVLGDPVTFIISKKTSDILDVHCLSEENIRMKANVYTHRNQALSKASGIQENGDR